MLRLPRNLPADLRAALQGCLAETDLERLLERFADSILQLFRAADVLLSFEHSMVPGVAEHQQILIRGSVLAGAPIAAAALCEKWRSSGIHHCARRDLESRLASLSHSAFSWPYPNINLDMLDEKRYSVPRDYSLFLPFSSDMIVGAASDPAFFGYAVLFFDRFPRLSENSVQLVITLPEILSGTAAAFMRKSLTSGAADLSTYAHDIKRHLLVSREFLQVLKEGDSAQYAKAVAGMERTLLRVLSRTNLMLLNDKDEQGNLKINPVRLQVNELVQEAAAELMPLFEAAQVGVELNLDPRLPETAVDPAVFPSVISNLLDNSLKYCDPGSRLIVRTIADANGSISIEFTDNGSDIEEHEREKIFLKGYRGENAAGSLGNGLGLHLVRRIVAAHSGCVTLEQRTENDKTFIVRLPAG